MTDFDPYYSWLGIPFSEQPPNHYRLLGIKLFESDPDVIQSAADRQMDYVVKCANGPQQNLSQRLLNELSTARACLLTPSKRRAYDVALRTRLKAPLQVVAAREETEVALTPGKPEVTASSEKQSSNRERPSTTIFAMGDIAGLAFVLIVWMCLPKASPKPSSAAAETEMTQQAPVANANQDIASTPIVAAADETTSDESDEPDIMVAADESTLEVPADSEMDNTVTVRPPDPANAATPKPPAEKDKPETPTGNEKKTADTAKANAKASATKKQKAIEVVEVEFPTVGFEFAMQAGMNNGPDPDTAPAGKSKLAEISNRAAAANKDVVAIDQKYRPMVVERAGLMAGLPAKQAAMLEAHTNMKQLDGRIAQIKDRPFKYSNDPLTMQENKLRDARDRFAKEYNANKNDVTNRLKKIEAIGKSLQSLDERFKKRWEELTACRKQWLDVCRPLDKYARGDFERMQRVIDKWLEVDEVWTDAYCWGAVAAFELNDAQVASYLVEKAEKLSVGILHSKRTSSQIDATQGLVVLKIPGQRSKSSSLIQKAMSGADKEGDWSTQFIAGRAMLEGGRQDGRAKAFLERAIKIEPNCQCTLYWLGCLQTTSNDKTVRDIDAGTKLLESVWSYTGKQSWRVSAALARADDAAERKADAVKQWETTLALAPESEHEQLKALKAR